MPDDLVSDDPPERTSHRRRHPAKPGHRRLRSRESAVHHPELVSPLLRHFNRSSVFTVWRPCSIDSIRAMMRGDAVGKGLDVKGKSARRGTLSGYVPFVQIHREEDKVKVRDFVEGGRMRVFYPTREAREMAVEVYLGLEALRQFESHPGGKKDDRAAPPPPPFLERIDSCARRRVPASVSSHCRMPRAAWGIEVDQSRFWSACVLSRRIDRPPGSDLDTGRPSEPAFQDMNLTTVRKAAATAAVGAASQKTSRQRYAESTSETSSLAEYKHGRACSPRAVVLQSSDDDPLDPRTLLMAYEECDDGSVRAVVSDLDCLIVGTRRVRYDEPLPEEQVRLVRWCVDTIASILDQRRSEAEEEKAGRRASGGGGGVVDPGPPSPPRPASWTQRWLEALKKESESASGGGGCGPHSAPVPPYGYGDPTSYSIMEHGIERFATGGGGGGGGSGAAAAGHRRRALHPPGCGAVRHGAECFNYAFPQELDHGDGRNRDDGSKFLVISDTLPGPIPWTYVSEPELRALLSKKIDAGFTFPLHPKWVLCDPGWREVYDKLLHSPNEYVQRSMDVWFPVDSGIRERIDEVSRRHPRGYAGVVAAKNGGRAISRRGGSSSHDPAGGRGAERTTAFTELVASSGEKEGNAADIGVDERVEDDADDGTAAMDLAEQQLRRFLALQRAKRKLRAALLIRNLGYSTREKKEMSS